MNSEQKKLIIKSLNNYQNVLSRRACDDLDIFYKYWNNLTEKEKNEHSKNFWLFNKEPEQIGYETMPLYDGCFVFLLTELLKKEWGIKNE